MIHKLNKERYAWNYIIPRLNNLWSLMDSYVGQLRSSVEQMTTQNVISKRAAIVQQNSEFKAFKNNFGAWFETTYPEYSAALDGAIISQDNIAQYIVDMGESYKDAETGKYIMADAEQSDRNTLADQIETELE